jgi:replicative DNA helicase
MKKTKPLDTYDLVNYEDITKAINGFEQASFNLLVADTGFGKSTFALNMMIDFVSQGIPVLYITTEMSETKTIQRFLQCTLDKTYKEMRKHHERIYKKEAKRPFDYNQLSDEQKKSIDQQIEKDIAEGLQAEKEMDDLFNPFRVLPLYIEHTSDLVEIKDIIKRYSNEENIQICVIDHINDVQIGSNFPNHTQYQNDNMKTKAVMEACKEFYQTKDKGGLEIPIIAVAQFRKGDNKGGQRMIDEIKGTSDMIQSASVIMYLYETAEQRKGNDRKENDYKISGANTSNLERMVTLQIMKGRNGGSYRRFLLGFKGAKSSFEYIDQIV